MTALRSALLALAALLAPIADARCPDGAAWPPSFSLHFDAKATRAVLSLSGTSSLSFTRQGDDYAFVSETSAGNWYSARQSSRGRIGPDGLLPFEYTERSGRKPETTTQLDWQAGRVSFSASERILPTQAQMQDRLSFVLQLGWKLRRHEPAKSLDVPIAGARNASIYRFESRGAERVETAAGRFDTVKFERPLSSDNDAIEIWLAPSLCGLPVRMRFTDHKGLVVENELKSARLD